MSNLNQTSKRSKTWLITWGLIIFGGLIGASGVFILLYGVVGGGIIGQLGDFVGGVSGSLWALAGVALFYLALQEQRKELALQREEFTVNRVLTVVYKQIERLDLILKGFQYDENIGLSGIYALEKSLNKIDWSETELKRLANSLKLNASHIKGLFNVILQSQAVIERATIPEGQSSTSQEEAWQNELKTYLFSNLDFAIRVVSDKLVDFDKKFNVMVEENRNKNERIALKLTQEKIGEIISIVKQINFL